MCATVYFSPRGASGATRSRRNLEDDSGRVRAGRRALVAHLVGVGAATLPERLVVGPVVGGRDHLHAIPPDVDTGCGI